MNKQVHTLEVLIVDQSGKSEITTVKSLIMAISYSEKVWEDAQLKNEASSISIEDKVLGISLQASKVESSASEGVAFLTLVTSPSFEKLEAFRERLFVHAIHKLGFTTARILTDTVSESISSAIAPLIKEVENVLRSHLEKALTQKLGLSWWASTASEAVNRKVTAQKSNEQYLVGLLDNNMALTDFDDLTDLVRQTSIADAAFNAKWATLSQLRKRTLVNGVFTSQDYQTAEKLQKELLQVLGASANKPVQTHFQPVPRENVAPASVQQSAPVPSPKAEPAPEPVKAAPVAEAVKQEVVQPAPTPAPVAEAPKVSAPQPVAEAVVVEEPKRVEEKQPVAAHSEGFDMITENVLLQELKTVQNLENGRYVDLKSFVTNTLGTKGYAQGPAYMVAKNMNEKGLVQIYDAKDAKGLSVKAIRVN